MSTPHSRQLEPPMGHHRGQNTPKEREEEEKNHSVNV